MNSEKKELTIATPGAMKNPVQAAVKQSAPPNVSTRQSLKNMGFDNNKIGWNGKAVTIDNQPVVQPAEVKDGTAYAPDNINVIGAKEYLSRNGYSGIRDRLSQMGVANDRIGFNNDTGYVQLDGADVYKPQYNIDGTTYATDVDINGMAKAAYDKAGDSLKAARDYVTSRGYTGVVNWDAESGTVNIGGTNLKPLYVQDGTAYIPQSQLDNAIAAYEKNSGIQTNKGVLDGYGKRYNENIGEALKKLLNRESFDYDPDKDEVFQAYKKQYEREAEDAYRKVLNDNNTSVHGASGAVLSQAMAARDSKLDKITDAIPTFAEGAYSRYTGETDRLRNNLGDLMNAENDYYDKAYQSNRDSINDSVSAGAAERNKQNVEDERYWANMKNAIDMGIYPQEKLEGLRNSVLTNNSTELAYKQAMLDHGISNANYRGKFDKSDEEYIPWLKDFRNDDGSYSISPYIAEMLYNYMTQYYNNKGAYDVQKGIYSPPEL